MPDNVNLPVLIGGVPLLYVQTMTINEGYEIKRIKKSQFYQALAPTAKTIDIQALLVGPERMALKKSLEIIALTSRLLVAGIGPFFRFAGVPVVSGLTISLNMMVTNVSFTQSVDKRETLDVSIKLQKFPIEGKGAIVGEKVDLALPAGSGAIPSSPQPCSVPREAG